MRGAFWTRIAYVTASGTGNEPPYALMVADCDGFNPQAVVSSPQPLLSPSWSPDGRKLAYVSFDRGNSSIYIQNSASGAPRTGRELPRHQRRAELLARRPQPRDDAFASSGNPEIYVMDLGSKQLRQMTNHFGIDTEAVWSADGGSLYFTSDRGGRPQIYQVSASGGGATRLTFQGSYNARATVSVRRQEDRHRAGQRQHLPHRADGPQPGLARWTHAVAGLLDESPSFAPNASMLLYAAKEGGRGVLYTVSADGRVRAAPGPADGDVQEPAWGPYRQQR